MKSTSTWCIAFVISLLSVAQPGLAKEYVIDPEHTSIHFRIGHWHFSRVQGRFNRISGSFRFDPAKPTASRVHIVVDVGSIDTNQKQRDDHLRAPAYFNVQRYPEAVFRSTRIIVTGKDTGRMIGNLTMLGVTRPVTLEVKFNGIAAHPFATRFKKYKGVVIAGFSARTNIERSKFGMTNGKGEKGEIVELSIEVEGWQK